jgi:predicted DNA-binding ribbon-helix-helix protein
MDHDRSEPAKHYETGHHEFAHAKHSVAVNGNKTSVSLEAPFWEVLREIARAKGTTVSELTSEN